MDPAGDWLRSRLLTPELIFSATNTDTVQSRHVLFTAAMKVSLHAAFYFASDMPFYRHFTFIIIGF